MLTFCLLVLGFFGAVASLCMGAGLGIVFADVLVCIALIVLLVKLLKKKK